jgi:hypothetical protein
LNDVADALGDLLLDEPTVRDACEHFVEIVAKGRWEKKRDVLPDDFTLNRSYMRSAPGLHLVITPSRVFPRMASIEESTIAAGTDAESRPHWREPH